MSKRLLHTVQTGLNGLVIAFLLFNSMSPALIAAAESLPAPEVQTFSGGEGIKGQEATPVGIDPVEEPEVIQEGSTETQTATMTPTETETEIVLPSETPTETPSPELSPTTTMTATATTTVTVTPTATPTGEPPSLSFRMSVLPEQAAPGETVSYTLTINNQGKNSVSGINFINTLPEGFNNPSEGNKDFQYDEKKRQLTWELPEGSQIQPGESLTLSYNIQLEAEMAEPQQVIDTALLKAEGQSNSLRAEAALMVLAAKKDLTLLESQDSLVSGMDGNVQVEMGGEQISEPQAIVVSDLSQKSQGEIVAEAQEMAIAEAQTEAEESGLIEEETETAPLEEGQLESEEQSLQVMPEAEGESIPEPQPDPSLMTQSEEEISQPEDDGLFMAFELQLYQLATEEATPAEVETAPLTGSILEVNPLQPAVEGTVEETPTQTATLEYEGQTELPEEEAPVMEEDRVVELKPVQAEFEEPVDVTVSFANLTNLAELSADFTPYMVTLDENSGTWVQVPLKAIDPVANTVTVETTHFSTWGAGIGPAFPQNGANVLLFDNASPDLFSGRARFSLPIWTPAGRNGMAPSLSLSYSSGTVDGILGDVQAGWAGMGWNVDTVEIARKITNGSCTSCVNGSYGYENKFVLLFNGTGYELVQEGDSGRYHTKSESFLYIQRHNELLDGSSYVAPSNDTGEWWEVVDTDGTRWRLGWNSASEQRAAMRGYPGSETGPWATLRYAGHALNVVASRWRADQATDVYGNQMNFTYEEETRDVYIGTIYNPGASLWAHYGASSFVSSSGYCWWESGGPGGAHCDDWWGRTFYFNGQRITYSLFSDETTPYSTCLTIDGISQGCQWMGYGSYGERSIVSATFSAGVHTATFYGPPSYYFRGATVGGSTGSLPSYDRASYLKEITYTANTTGSLTPAYSVEFVRADRSGEVPEPQYAWDNWDTQLLDKINIKYNGNTVRTYDLSYVLRPITDDGKTWNTTVLSSVAVSAGEEPNKVSLPVINFTYSDKDNRSNCGTGCYEWAYPRLTSINNGWGGMVNFTYANDGRANTSWYNWRVETQDTYDGVNNSPVRTTFAYSSPCYKDDTAGRCNNSYIGELVGYGQTIVTTGDNYGSTIRSISVHKFITADEQKEGREFEVAIKDPSGNMLSKTETSYTVDTSHTPAGGYFIYANEVKQFVEGGSSPFSRTVYTYDTSIGAMTLQQEYKGTETTPYRQTAYQYISNTTPGVWILNKVASVSVEGGNPTPTLLSKVEYGYDNNQPNAGTLIHGALTLKRVVNVGAASNVDTSYSYDNYGNLIQTTGYPESGNESPRSNVVEYDNTVHIYPIVATNAKGQSMYTTYDYASGLPTTVTDANGGVTTTSYDSLGRTIAVTYPGYDTAHPNVKYIYPTGPSDGKSAIEMQLLDEFAATSYTYRSAWQITDGLGRVIQTQTQAENTTDLIVSDVAFNALGATVYQGLPRTITASGGTYDFPNWNNVSHSSTFYDYLGRVTQVTYADGSHESSSYSYESTTGLLVTTAIDRNNHQKIQRTDVFGRLQNVEDFTGSGPYTSYGTTNYTYNVLGLLTGVTDAEGKQISLTYDGLGRKIGMNDPNMGIWGYAYDAWGNLQTQTDARGCTTTVTYDELQRPLTKSYTATNNSDCSNTPPVAYSYDDNSSGNKGVGHRTGMTVGSGSDTITSAWTYNILGQVTASRLTIGTTNYDTTATYDAFGRLRTQVLPKSQTLWTTPETLTYNYNATGALSSVMGANSYYYLSQVNYNVNGQVTDQQLGNGVTQQSCYNASSLRLTNLRAYTGTKQGCDNENLDPENVRLSLSYTYQANGNIATITDAVRAETVTYTYDELNRLLSASGMEDASGKSDLNQSSFSYNKVGNMTSMVDAEADYTALTTENYHTCALTASGALKCWGDNSKGQLGDGTTTNRNTPVDVSGLTGGVTLVAAGSYHTCALVNGIVKCWGYNASGQLGTNNTTNSTTPLAVSSLSGSVTAIAAGAAHTCVLIGGGVKCWGDNSRGQLGNGTTTNSSIPVDVSGLDGTITAITAGAYYTCALKEEVVNDVVNRSVKCWGANSSGQLGNNSTTDSSTPVDVISLTSGVTAIAAGYSHTCALDGGVVKCWGNNEFGQLGNNTTTNSSTPVSVSGISGAAKITVGLLHSCAQVGGKVDCWGLNYYGELGNTSNNDSSVPVEVSSLSDLGVNDMIVAGQLHSCALKGGAVKCWGDNSRGQLGNGESASRSAPDDLAATLITYTYGDSAHPYAVASRSTGETYAYDANGNMTQRVEGGKTYGQAFDAENRLISVTVSGSPNQVTQFKYDADGNMVEKINPDGSYVLYIGSVMEIEKNSSGTETQVTLYYPGGAVRVVTSPTANALYYVLGDQLGSASVTLNSSGTTVSGMRYYPFGETRVSTGTLPTDKLFTGQRAMEDLGIYYYGARFYDPYLNRWIQPDTIIPGAGNSQAYDRYAYVYNSPIIYNDPTGHMGAGPEGGSPIKKITPTSSTQFLLDPGNIQAIQAMISDTPTFLRSPIDLPLVLGVQWFGKTQNALEMRSIESEKEMYAYSNYMHAAIDYLAPYGTPIYSPFYGKVTFAPTLGQISVPDGPYRVVLDLGNGYLAKFIHTDGVPFVKAGDYVTPGTLLTGVGNMCGEPMCNRDDHMHFVVYYAPDDYYYNPLMFMDDEMIVDLIKIADTQVIEGGSWNQLAGQRDYHNFSDLLEDSFIKSRIPGLPFDDGGPDYEQGWLLGK